MVSHPAYFRARFSLLGNRSLKLWKGSWSKTQVSDGEEREGWCYPALPDPTLLSWALGSDSLGTNPGSEVDLLCGTEQIT